MPFNELHRRDSWPPTQIRLNNDEDDIDANPFSYFLTSPEDIDLEDMDSEFDEDLSAGIESAAAPRPIVREVSPSSLQRKRLEATDDDDDEDYIRDLSDNFGLPVSLLDFSSSHKKKKLCIPSSTDFGEGHPRLSSSPSIRGRRPVQLVPSTTGRGRARNRTRSLSAQRPHLWREPSPDVWSIPEESEGSGSGSDKGKEETGTALQLSAGKENAGDARKEGLATKLKKKVRWAALPSRY